MFFLDFDDLHVASSPFQTPSSVSTGRPHYSSIITTTTSNSTINQRPAMAKFLTNFSSKLTEIVSSPSSINDTSEGAYHQFHVVTTAPAIQSINNNNIRSFSSIKDNNNGNNLTTKPINGNYRIAAKIIINEGRQG